MSDCSAYIDDPKIDWLGKRVFCRLDLNVPINKNTSEILDDTRIKAALETIKFLLSSGARLIISSHLGRPKGKARKEYSLEPIAERLRDLLEQEITFAHESIGDGVKRLISEIKPGQILFLENLRFHSGEEKNDENFAKQLSQNIDIYVNDAFGVCHREHASVLAVTDFIEKKYAGFLIRRELEELEKLIKKAQKPFVACLGGAKISDKLGALSQLLNKTNVLLVGGAMAYVFLKSQEFNIGASKCEDSQLDIAKTILKKAKRLGVKLILPIDHRVTKKFEENSPVRITKSFESDDIGIDIGPETQKLFSEYLESAQSIFWNGPMGVSEWQSGFAGTLELAKSIAASSAFSIVGGGDSILALNQAGLLEEVSYVSTGGGASLALIEKRELPALKPLGIAKL